MTANKRLQRFTCLAVLLIALLTLGLPTAATVQAAPIQEVEPNDTAETAQVLPTIGTDDSVSAAINQEADRDWYAFDAVEGHVYTIEIFDAALAFAQEQGNGCGSYGSGVGLRVYDPTGAEIAKRCTPAGAGNVHNILQFKAGLSGVFRFLVVPHGGSATGTYGVRVLPEFSETGANWDSATQEPNNTRLTAFELKVGSINAVTSSILERNSSFATNRVDYDWYRFAALAGQDYVIELFDTALALGTQGTGCDALNSGVGLRVYDPNGAEVTSRCTAGGAGNVHNILQFKAGLSGTYFFWVIPNDDKVYGTYGVRVLPSYDQPETSWDVVTFEPNNRLVNAYALDVGRANAITSDIEERNSSYATNAPDRDAYRFQVNSGQTYTVELFDVADNLRESGILCNLPGSGLGLIISNSSFTEIAKSCSATERNNIHNAVTFRAGEDGTSFVLVQPNAAAAFGTYSLRVRTADESFRTFLPLLGR